MYPVIDLRLRPPYKSFATTSFYQNQEKRRSEGTESRAAIERDMDLMIKEMDENNIVYGVAIARESEWGGAAKNSDLPGLLADYPNRFIGVIHLQYGAEKEPLESIEEYILHGPCTGVYMEPSFRFEKSLMHADDERLFPIYEKCEKDNIPVYVTWGGLCATPEIYEPHIIENVAKSFPKLRMFLGHAGFPRSAEHCVLAINHPNIYLGIDLYIINSPAAQDFIVAGNYACKNQICFGSAYPLNLLNEAVDSYKKSFHEDVWENIFYNNSAKFVGIE